MYLRQPQQPLISIGYSFFLQTISSSFIKFELKILDSFIIKIIVLKGVFYYRIPTSGNRVVSVFFVCSVND